MKRILAAALLVSPLVSAPAYAALEKAERAISCSKDGVKTACDQNQNEDARASASPKPAVDISVRIRSPWAKIDIRLNFG